MPLQLEIVTPERLAYSDAVDAVNVPGIDGELGILPHHAPMVAILGRGVLRLEGAAGASRFQVDGGFLQVVDDQVRVVTERAAAV